MALPFKQLAHELAEAYGRREAHLATPKDNRGDPRGRIELDLDERVMELMAALTRARIETSNDALTAVGLANTEADGALNSVIDERECSVVLLRISRLLYGVAEFLREAGAEQDPRLAEFLLAPNLDPRKL